MTWQIRLQQHPCTVCNNWATEDSFKKLLGFQTARSLWQLSDVITVGWFNPVKTLWLLNEVKGTLCTVLEEVSPAISSRRCSWGHLQCLCIDLVADWSGFLSGRLLLSPSLLVVALHQTVEYFQKPETCSFPDLIAERPRRRASLHLHNQTLQRWRVQRQRGLSFIH